jgi:hypothetical protein
LLRQTSCVRSYRRYLNRDYELPTANSADDARLPPDANRCQWLSRCQPGGWMAVSRDKIKELTKQYLAAEQAIPS